QVNAKLNPFIQRHDTTASARPFLFAVNDWRLRSNFEEGKQTGGRIEYVRLFALIALIILVIACINFMNLATARSEQRSREVGVRKVMGAGRGMLVSQFIGESLFMSFISGLLAVMVVLLALPAFNYLVDKQLVIDLLNPMHSLGLVAICTISGLIAGSYPSLYLSSFNPISVFKGLNAGTRNSAAFIRKGLVVTQFVISIVLIIATVIIYQQVQHVRHRSLGYNKDNLIYLDAKGNLMDKFDAIRQDLLASGAVQNAALSNSSLIEMGNSSGGFEWEGKDSKSEILISTEAVSAQYIATTGMQLKAGRDFYEGANADTSSIIINETLEKIMGKENAVGQIIKVGDSQATVIGVVKDFIYSDMYKKPDPLIFFCQPVPFNYMFIRLKDGYDVKEALAKTEAVLKKGNPGYPFEYIFFDAEFDKQFKSEMLAGTLSRLFAMLAIFITCLGLFGLAAYTAERRTKEIGIRKVLGATLSNIVSILSRDFLKLVSIAALIAFPIAWIMMSKWLEDYAYRITISWWVFFLSGIGALIIALFTVSFQAIKAGMMNPVKSLRTE
ncbi:MAG: FtsX-like permease family protein, partial [Chitinophagales bacterium]